jgi:hypothetical protein
VIFSQAREGGNAEKKDEDEGSQREEDGGRLNVQHNQAQNKGTLGKSGGGAAGEMRGT